MTIWRIERLAAGHDRAAFDCGQPLLDDWIRTKAGQFDRKDLARTYVVVDGESRVLGYYALSNHHVRFESLPKTEGKGLPRIAIPVVLLGRLAVNGSSQGQGLGSFLLIDALRRVLTVADTVGIRAVEVDAIDETAKRFYQKFGFVELLDDPRHLFLPLSVIRKLNLDPKS